MSFDPLNPLGEIDELDPLRSASGLSSVWGTTKPPRSAICASALDSGVYKSPLTPASGASSIWGTTKSAYSAMGVSALSTEVYKSPFASASGLSSVLGTTESSPGAMGAPVLGTGGLRVGHRGLQEPAYIGERTVRPLGYSKIALLDDRGIDAEYRGP
jgi:hypothetical protein